MTSTQLQYSPQARVLSDFKCDIVGQRREEQPHLAKIAELNNT